MSNNGVSKPQPPRRSISTVNFRKFKEALRVVKNVGFEWTKADGSRATYDTADQHFAAGTFGKLYKVRRTFASGDGKRLPEDMCLKVTATEFDAKEEATGVELATATCPAGFVQAMMVQRPNKLPAVLMVQYTTNLHSYVVKNQPPPLVALGLLEKLTNVAVCCWEKGVAVCDIKMANVLVMQYTDGIDVRFCDLGGVRRIEDAFVRDTFPPPEHALDAFLNLQGRRRPRVVVWQLGMLLVGMIGNHSTLSRLEERACHTADVIADVRKIANAKDNRALAAAMHGDVKVRTKVTDYYVRGARNALRWIYMEQEPGA